MRIEVNIARQRLVAYEESGNVFMDVDVSTARNGVGEKVNSNCTPRGLHKVRAKIGDGVPINTVFRGRRPVDPLYSPALRQQHPGSDWILTRILWLSGLEPGFNRLGNVDTMRRYIYIHGCPDDDPVGVAGSAGCIKMRNNEIIELFQRVPVGTPVTIFEN